jgi:hypothetical protein
MAGAALFCEPAGLETVTSANVAMAIKIDLPMRRLSRLPPVKRAMVV